MNNFFLSDISDEVGNLNEVESHNFQFEKYKIKEIEGENFIVGDNPKNLFNTGSIMNNIDLLFSLIGLVKTPMPEYYDQEQFQRIITDKDILKWVKKYGIPYKDTHLNKIKKDQLTRANLLCLNGFRYELFKLYSAFALWKGLVEEDPEEIKKRKWVALNNLDGKSTSDEEQIKIGLAAAVFPGGQLLLKYDTKTRSYKYFMQHSNSLISVAFYQLSAIMTKPDGKRNLKYCEECSSIFWAKHAKTKYCPNCNYKTIHSRKKRQKGSED